MGQVAHFDVSQAPFDPSKLLHGFNSLLPEDISVLSLKAVPGDFHAQLSAKRKIYEYRIFNSAIRDPFLQEYSWRIPYPLDLAKMKKAAKMLVGEHDFRAFCASDSKAKTTVRKVYRIVIASPEGAKQSDIIISITGSGFLKQMVRNIVGTLVDVGRGRMTVVEFQKGFKSCDRRRTGRAAPAKGLFLKDVIY